MNALESPKGKVFLVMPTMRIVEVIEGSRLLDLCFCVELNLEGEQTGRYGHFAPSKLVAA